MATHLQHLAQANIARMVAPVDQPSMSGFVAQLDRFNALAESSPGFVWRLKTADGNATAIRAFDDELILFNMSVWNDIEALYRFTYRSEHREPLRDRRKWFTPLPGPHLVLWWVPAGRYPTVEEARDRFDLLSRSGPGPEGFTFQQPFSPLGEPIRWEPPGA